MNLTIEVPGKIVLVLRAKAQAEGLTLETWFKRLAEEESASGHSRSGADSATHELPLWHLGATSSLRWRDLYDDLR
jgi:hypothetical protein